MTKHRILWVEEDYLDAFEAAITITGYDLKRAFFVSDAEALLKDELFDLLLLDVMIPIEAADINLGYTNENTMGGDRTGLAFFERNKQVLENRQISVLVYTICGDDPEVRNSFIKLGLDPANFVNKVMASNVNTLLNEMARVLRYKKAVSDNSEKVNE